MNFRSTGGPAFPLPNDEASTGTMGMSLRDYFAAKAMQVCLAQCTEFPDEAWRTCVAADAYAMADAMIKARMS